MPARRPHPWLALLALLAGGLGGCGAGATVAPGGTLQVGLTEFRVRPQSVSARAGPLTLVIHNYGRLSHNLVISLDGHPEFATKPIPPGQSAQLYATLAAGTYLIDSTVLADQALGVYGTLSVHG